MPAPVGTVAMETSVHARKGAPPRAITTTGVRLGSGQRAEIDHANAGGATAADPLLAVAISTPS